MSQPTMIGPLAMMETADRFGVEFKTQDDSWRCWLSRDKWREVGKPELVQLLAYSERPDAD